MMNLSKTVDSHIRANILDSPRFRNTYKYKKHTRGESYISKNISDSVAANRINSNKFFT